MTTYYVRQDGLETDYSLATSNTAAGSMTLATMNTAIAAGNFSSGDILTFTAKGGVYSGASVVNAVIDGLMFIGETGYRPYFDMGGTYEFQITGVSNSLIENMTIFDAALKSIFFAASGTGNIVRNVLADTGGKTGFSTQDACQVDYYDCQATGHADDGWASHGTTVVNMYGCYSYGNKQGMEVVGSGVLNAYDCTFAGNRTGVDSADVSSRASTSSTVFPVINFYDCTFSGAVTMPSDINSAVKAIFHRCNFLCQWVSDRTGYTNGCFQAGKGHATEVSQIEMYGCRFNTPPSGKHQATNKSDNISSSYKYESCTFSQSGAGQELGLVITGSVAPAADVINCAFENCSTGLFITSSGYATVTTCNFDPTCTADFNSTPTYNTDATTDYLQNASGFEQPAIGDIRLASGSALIDAGSDLTITHDVEGRPYSTADIGCYADTDEGPSVPGARP